MYLKTRIEEVEEFKVKGYGLKGALSDIPSKWDLLNGEIAKKDVGPEESFGVCLEMEGDKLHYIAGINSSFAEDFTDTEEVVIPAGKFLVAEVEGGIPAIRTTFEAIFKMNDIRLRKCYSFQRYIYPEGSSGYEIEVWMPIE